MNWTQAANLGNIPPQSQSREGPEIITRRNTRFQRLAALANLNQPGIYRQRAQNSYDAIERSLSRNYRNSGQGNETNIQPYSPGRNVYQPEPAFPGPDQAVVIGVRIAAAAEYRALVRENDRSEIGKTGANAEQATLARGIQIDTGLYLWPGPDKTHVAPQHVP